MTPIDGVFSAGDFVSGASTIIEAVGAGRATAASIHRYLHTRFAPDANWPEPAETVPLTAAFSPAPNGLHPPAGLSFDHEVEQTLHERDAVADALRCLFCGLLPTVILEACTACHACAVICPVDPLHRVAVTESGAIGELTGDRDVLGYQVWPDECIRCGRCFMVCPTGAIVVDVGAT